MEKRGTGQEEQAEERFLAERNNMDESTKPNCYKCEHRGKVPGSAHSKCDHPESGLKNTSALEGLASIFASVGRCAAPPMPDACTLEVKGHEQGIRRGWFSWPHNFDPVWLVACNGFEARAPITKGLDGG